MSRVDVAVIGAGPAGLAAAAVLAGAGVRTVVFDEQAQAGGQIYRAIERTPLQRRDTLGADYWAGLDLVRQAHDCGASFEYDTTVWSLDETLEIGVLKAGAARMVEARAVLVATGAMERPFPIPGWTLPGVLTAGAAQILLKTSGLVAQGQVVLAGTGPLLWLIAAQTLRAGGRIAALLDTTSGGARWPRPGVDLLRFMLSPLFRHGLALQREVRRSVRVIAGVTELQAIGTGRVEAVRYTGADGRPGELPADTLLLHQGVVPNTNLAAAAGAQHRWHEVRLCFEPVLDTLGQTTVPGIWVAGDGAGIGGAPLAAERGRLAAVGLLRALGVGGHPSASAAAESRIRRAMAPLEAARPFLDRYFQPAERFRIPSGATVVCRCEEVTAEQVRHAVALGCAGPNQLKAILRCGMGPCQGRQCGLTVTELMARERGETVQAIGHYRLRPPVKPITLGALAQLPVTDEAVRAVVRP